MNNFGDSLSEIRVLIADDSVVTRAALTQLLKSSPRIQICGFARNGVEAIERARLLEPDVITMDVTMPVLDGIHALKQIMKERPCPVIMVSSSTLDGAAVTLEALDAGAFDYIQKEDLRHATNGFALRHVLLEKIEAAARSHLAPRRSTLRSSHVVSCSIQRSASARDETQGVPRIIVIGASTGGPQALQEVLTAFPGDLPAPVLVVQHMPPGFTAPLASRLDGLCRLRVHEARQGELLERGTAYRAPAGQHTSLFASPRGAVSLFLSQTPAETLHKPSVDVAMLAVAQIFGSHSLGVILTGMGSDGLRGMTAIRDCGGITIGQDEATSAVYGMPRSCAEHGVLRKILPLPEIAGEVLAAFHQPAWS